MSSPFFQLLKPFKLSHVAHILLIAAMLLATGPVSLAIAEAVQPKNSISGEKTIVFIGDSLTQGYGVQDSEAYPAVTGQILNKKGNHIRVINGGISGSVTADADRRVKWYLKARPDILVLALGGNDALRGSDPAVIKKNLSLALRVAQEHHLPTLLCGIQVFTNFGAKYNSELKTVFQELAREFKVELWEFLLEGVALDKTLMQADGKHPNAKGHAMMAQNMAKKLEPLLKALPERRL